MTDKLEHISFDVNRLPSSIGNFREDGKRELSEKDGQDVLAWLCGQIKKHRGKDVSVTMYPMPWWLVPDVTILLYRTKQVKRIECRSVGQPGTGHIVNFDGWVV